MTPQKTIDRLTSLIEAEKLILSKFENVGSFDRKLNIQAYETAIKAIEKQMPKKIIIITAPYDMKIGSRVIHKGTTIYKCSCCNSFVSRASKYCGKCGQALKWE